MSEKIEKFEDFLNERKTREEKDAEKAKTKLAKAEKWKEKAKDAYEEGKDKRGDKRTRKAKKYEQDALELNPDLDTSELDAEIKEIEDTDWKEEFDITTSFLGRKVKAKDLEFIKKLKIKGDEISPDELVLFLKTVKTYINEYWDEIEDEKGTDDYRSTHHDEMILQVKHRRNKVVFNYKEGRWTDKVKLVIDKDVFDDEDNKEKLSDELDKLIGTKHLTDKEEGRVADKYRKDKDKKILTPVVVADVVIDKTEDLLPKVEDVVEELNTPDNGFIQESIKILIDEKLFRSGVTSFHNTDEQRIFDHFVTKNAKKTINPKNVDAILRGYKQKIALRESKLEEGLLGDMWDATVDTVKGAWGATKRAFQSVVGTESKGVVQDLMWAYNTDAKTVSSDMNEMLKKLGDAYGDMLTKQVKKTATAIKKEAEKNPDKFDELAESIMISEDTGDMITGGMIGAQVMKSRMKKKAGQAVAGETAKQFAKRQAYKGFTRAAASQTAKKVGGRALARGIGGRLLSGALLTPLASIGPVGWVIIGVVGTAALGTYLWNTFDEQQHQIAHIFLLMWASQSPVFLQEMNRAGIKINKNLKANVNIEELEKILSTEVGTIEGEVVDEGDNTNESNIVKTFEAFYEVNNKDLSMFNMNVTDTDGNVIFNESVEYDAIKELKKDFKEKGYKITLKKDKDDK
jgi:hypothetical protein